MPITIQNSAGGGVTLDSTTTSNETLQLPSGGGTLTNTTDLALKAPIASPSFTGGISVTGSTAHTAGDITNSISGSYKLFGANGTAGSTAYVTYAFEGDNNTGMYHPAADTLGFVTGGTARLKVFPAGDVVIGSAYSPTAANGNFQRFTGTGGISQFGVTGTNNLQQIQFFNGNGGVGGIFTNGSSTSYNTSSDYRLKENVVPMSGATAQTKLLKPCNFDWIAGGNVNGFLAHELAEVVPEAVTGIKDAMKDEEYEVTPAVLDDEGNETTAAVMGTRSVPDMQGIDQSKLVPLLTATIQELIARIEALENV